MSRRADDSSARTGARLGGAVLTVAVVSGASKLLGFGEKLVVARLYGTGASADVYFAAMGVLWAVVFFAMGLLQPALLPVYSDALASGRRQAGRLFGKVFRRVACASFATAAVVLAAGPWLARVVAPGFTRAQWTLAGGLLRGLAPAVAIGPLMVTTYVCLNARKRFGVAAAGPMLLKAAVLAALIGLAPAMGVHAVAVGVGAGAALALVVHAAVLGERGYVVRRGGPSDAATAARTRELHRLARPLLVGIAASHLGVLVDNALVSTLPVGRLSALQYARRLIDAVLLVGPVALVTVSYAHLSALSAAGQTARRDRFILRTTRLVVFICIPLTVLLVELRTPLVSTLFAGGRFGADSVLPTARAFALYAAGTTAMALDALFVSCFCAMHDTRTPVIVGLVFAAFDAAATAALLTALGYAGVPLAYVVARSAKVAVLGALLSRRVRSVLGERRRAFLLRTALATAAGWVSLRLVAAGCGEWGGAGRPLQLPAPAVAFAAAFAATAWALGLTEARTLLVAVLRTLRRVRALLAGGRGGACAVQEGTHVDH